MTKPIRPKKSDLKTALTRRAKRRAYQIVLMKSAQAAKKRRNPYRELLQVTEEVIVKPGKLSEKRRSWQNLPWFKKQQRFRAGIEGNLSTLLRKFGLKRCLWKGC